MNLFSPREMQIQSNGFSLKAILTVPEKAEGIVLFAHGSGSVRLSPRNQFVAKELNKHGFATLLADLLTEKEDETYETRFDISLLTERLKVLIQWLKEQKETKDLPVGLFGASTGAAAALDTAAFLGTKIRAVVSRGGRPDLAKENISAVTAPVLLIVGGNDFPVLTLNQKTLPLLKKSGEKEMKIIPGATHLFEEKDALEAVSKEATRWFRKYLR